MAIQATYKKYKRGQRLANVETDFTSGMMFSEGAISDGYVKTLVNFDFTEDGRNALKPRAALTTCEILVPDMTTELSESDEALYLDEDTTIKYSKECVENGIEYRQFIIGKPSEEGGEITDTGRVLILTSPKSINDFNDVVVSQYDLVSASSSCAFYNTGLTEIHGVELTPDAKTAFPVGAFLGNSFYYFSAPHNGALKHTVFNVDRYNFASADIRELTASEAVNYGYNMLDSNPYVFNDSDQAAVFEMQGILPYDHQFTDAVGEPVPKLLMNPRANSRVWFRCNYDVTDSNIYKVIWSWKEVAADEWTVFHTEESFQSTDTPVLQADLIVPAKEILIRCEAYNNTDLTVVEKAMTVGFDFSLDPENTTRNIKEENYDLSTASGMISWKNRLVVWGLPKDPTILFISDLDEPGYFPYPNNVVIFDEPIIAVVELMDNLIVFTKSKVHQVAFNDDGTSWTSTVIQSNLYIENWDKHLIQSVRNMVYFKSGNYYYMIVPKAQSTTGELTLAPITTPITDFFNHFKQNVTDICKNCFKYEDSEGNIITPAPEHMVTYYNFIDYENIHNFYVYKEGATYVHFDIIYNVVARYWKINIYESAHFLYPFRNDATQNGLLAGLSTIKVYDSDNLETYDKRIIQLFEFNQLTVEDLYIIAGTTFIYSSTFDDVYVNDEEIIIPFSTGTYDSSTEDLTVNPVVLRPSTLAQENLTFIQFADYIGGFNRQVLYDTLHSEAEILKQQIVYSNKQMLDTGYRDANLFVNKRYRELQLQINNINNVDMEFGMDFQISGETRNTDFLYEVSQTIDELNQDRGIVYLDATPYMPIPYIDGDERKGEIDKVNLWTLEHSVGDASISLWKVRASVSGKGVAPRLRLFTRKGFDYQLLGINWIYREMNMR